MSDDETVTPAEQGARLSPERKSAEREATGFRDTAAIERNEQTNADAGNVILRSVRKLKRLPHMLGRVHSDI
jgi:hypothetical protein